MTSDQKTAIAATAKRHGPNVLMLVAGVGVLVFGWSNPDQSAALIDRVVQLVGALMAGGAALNAARMGHDDKSEQDKREIKQEIRSTLPDEVASKIFDRLAVVQYLGDELRQTVDVNTTSFAQAKERLDHAEQRLDSHDAHLQKISPALKQVAEKVGVKYG